MKFFKKILIASISVFILSLPIDAHADRSAETAPLSQISFSEVSIAVEMHASLPRSAGRDPQLMKRLRRGIEQAFDETRAQANRDYREFGSESFNPYSLTANWTEQFVSDRYLSLLEISHYYTGGAHGNTGYTSLLWDIQESREILLEDIFDNVEDGSPALKAIARQLRRALISEKMERMDFSAEEAQNDDSLNELKATIQTMQTFTFVPSREPGKVAGIAFTFGPYYLGSYAEGEYRLYVSANVFEAFLQPAFRNLFGGEPVLMETLTGYPMTGPAILLEEPGVSSNLTSPLALKGEAPDYWFEYGVATVELYVNDIKIAETKIEAMPDATTSGTASGMVRFFGDISFENPEPDSYGELRFIRGEGFSTSGVSRISHWIDF